MTLWVLFAVAADGKADLASARGADAEDLFGGAIKEWLVERYVRGRELAVNAFSVDGCHRILDIWEYRQPDSRDYDQPYWEVVQLRADDPDWAATAEFVERVLDGFEVRLGPATPR